MSLKESNLKNLRRASGVKDVRGRVGRKLSAPLTPSFGGSITYHSGPKWGVHRLETRKKDRGHGDQTLSSPQVDRWGNPGGRTRVRRMDLVTETHVDFRIDGVQRFLPLPLTRSSFCRGQGRLPRFKVLVLPLPVISVG